MKKVLIAEDSKVDLKLIAKVVEDCGCCVIRATDGTTAWKILLDNDDISLVITDFMMPEMNGEQLVTSIRNHKVHSEVPVIIISGRVKLSDIAHVMDSGASRFLPKPINVNELKDYVQSLLK